MKLKKLLITMMAISMMTPATVSAVKKDVRKSIVEDDFECLVMSAEEVASYVQGERRETLDAQMTSGKEDTDTTDDQDKDGMDFSTRRLIIAADSLSGSYGAETVIRYQDLDNYLLQYATEEDARSAYRQIMQDPHVKSCYVDSIITTENLCADGWFSYPKMDTESNRIVYSWGTAFMGMDQLGLKVENDQAVTVAVIDTGMDVNSAFFDNTNISDDCYNFTTSKKGIANMDDQEGHGTGVCSIVADAVPDNVAIMPLKIAYQEETTISLMISALDYAIENDADVINCSFFVGTSEYGKGPLDEALQKAKDHNVAVVCSSGNAGEEGIVYPASSELTIAVGAIASDYDYEAQEFLFDIAYFSNYDDRIDFTAPGDQNGIAVIGGNPGEFDRQSGTSFSSPEIAAAYAYMKMLYPDDSLDQLYTRMKSICIDMGDPGKDDYYGWGVPDFSKLLKKLHLHKFTASKAGSHSHQLTCSCGFTKTRNCITYRIADDSGKIVCSECGRKLASTFKDGKLTVASADKAFVSIRGLVNAIRVYSDSDYPSLMTSAVIEEGYTSIEPMAFYTSCALKNISFPNTLERIENNAFDSANALKKIDLSDTSLYFIGDYAFYWNTQLEEVLVPDTLKHIGIDAFVIDSSLESIDLSHTEVESIGRSAFGDAENLKSILFPETLKSMSYMALRGTGLETVDLSMTQLETIEMHTFFQCSSLRTVIMPKTLKIMEVSIFDECPNISEVYFTGTVPEEYVDPKYGSGAWTDRTLTAYYPAGDSDWNDVKNHPENYQFGGRVTWKSYDPEAFIPGMNIHLSDTSLVYSGNAQMPGLVLTSPSGRILQEGTDYTLSCSDNTNAGRVLLTIKGKTNDSGSAVRSFVIRPASLSKLTLSANAYTYDGAAHYPKVTLKAGKLSVLSKATVGNKNVKLTLKKTNKKPGSYTVKAVGQGNYEGSLSAKYSINVKGSSISKVTGSSKAFTAYWSSLSSRYVSGYELMYSTSKADLTDDAGKTITVAGSSASTRKVTGLKAKKYYYVKLRTYVTISGKKYYSGWSDTLKVKTK